VSLGSEYPVIKLTEGGRAAMTGKVPVEMAFPLTRNDTHWATRKSPGPTCEETWQLWKQGETLFEIADARALTRSTVTGHLLQLMAEGRQIDIGRIIPPERRKMIAAAIAKAGNDLAPPALVIRLEIGMSALASCL